MDGSSRVKNKKAVISTVPVVTPERKPILNLEKKQFLEHLSRNIRTTITSYLFKRCHDKCEHDSITEIPVVHNNFEESGLELCKTGQCYRSPKQVFVEELGISISHHCLYESECQHCYSCSLCGRPMCVDVYRDYDSSPCTPLGRPRRSLKQKYLTDDDYIWMYLTKDKDCKSSWGHIYEKYRKSHCMMQFFADRALEEGLQGWNKQALLKRFESYHEDFGLDESFYSRICEKLN